MKERQASDKPYLLVDDNTGTWVGGLTEADHLAWLSGTLEVFQRADDGRLFELTTCDPFIYPGCWEWASADA